MQAIPGNESFSNEEIEKGFDTLIGGECGLYDNRGEPGVSRRQMVEVLNNLTGETTRQRLELSIDELLDEYGDGEVDIITRDVW